MKSSTSFSLAAITFLSTMTSTYGVSCMDPDKHNPTATPQCINVGTGGYTCQNVRLGGAEPDYQCVAPPPTSAPTSDYTSCTNPSTYNPTFTPQCINVGSGGYTCKNVRLGGTPEYRCVAPAPTAAPTPAAIVSCMDPAKHNPTATPQCINVGSGGYTCKNVRLGGEALYQCVPPGDNADDDDDDDDDYNNDDDYDEDDFEFVSGGGGGGGTFVGGTLDKSNDEQDENAAINNANVVGLGVDSAAAASDRAVARLTLSSLIVAAIAAIM